MSEIKTNKISPRKGTTQTIGDSGDTISIPCGVTTTNAGTISTAGITGGTIDNQGTITGLQGVINWDTTAKTTNFNASSQAGYFVNTTSGAITVTFPASPTAGDVIALKDYANTFDSNNLTIDPNGNNIQGAASNFTISVEGTSTQFIYVDATRGWVLTDASKASDIAEAESFIVATGGTVTCCGDYKIHTFTGPGTFTVTQVGNPLGSTTVDYLVLAGGGSGGAGSSFGGGGGGAGGFRSNFPSCCSGVPVSVTGYPITVGGGGASFPVGSPYEFEGNAGNPGSNSIFSTITSAGGGGGGGRCNVGLSGGSGGGGGSPSTTAGSGNTPPVSPPQGNSGGTGVAGPPNFPGGGGGGAAAVGSNGGPGSAGPGGPGGAGVQNNIDGNNYYWAGGGGANAGGVTSGQPGGNGGIGGGGAGSGSNVNAGGTGGGSAINPGGNGTQPPSALGGNGGTNSGGGGGATIAAPGTPLTGAGGSGIVIIRYKYQ